jgi:hypothetical protein
MTQTNHRLHSVYILKAKHRIGTRALFSSDPNIISTQAQPSSGKIATKCRLTKVSRLKWNPRFDEHDLG